VEKRIERSANMGVDENELDTRQYELDLAEPERIGAA
jgi:hypothetical protein